jgi:phosphopantothenoylcysteine synthetase/decarboxylase
VIPEPDFPNRATPSLAGRRVLVTAGPTQVPLDAVRFISNVSSGRTGVEIARAAASAGARVTLLLGAGRIAPDPEATYRTIDFVTFDHLHAALRHHVGSGAYDALVHAAAVSDYRPVTDERGKIPSDTEELVLRLQRTPKLVDEVRALDPAILLVKFKLEVARSEEELLEIARKSRAASDADFILANDLARKTGADHHAYLVDRSDEVVAQMATTAELALRLCGTLAAALEGRARRSVPIPASAGFDR